jgi:hypothetical protein
MGGNHPHYQAATATGATRDDPRSGGEASEVVAAEIVVWNLVLENVVAGNQD